MTLKDFFKEIDEEVSTILASEFEIEVTETDTVPNFDDSAITFDDLDENVKKCKSLESCVLYVDMRDSSQISAEKKPRTLAKIYSSFVRSMIASGRYYGGHIRNIIGDRVMVVFDKNDCFKKAVDTAILMNSVSQYIVNRRITDITFKCGIGIDYGKMLIAKAGAIRQGAEKEFYRSLVWLGRPANVASKLTDLAFKSESNYLPGVSEGFHYPNINEFHWLDRTYEQFIDNLETTSTRLLRHKDEYFFHFFKISLGPYKKDYKPILMTKAVYDGLKRSYPEEEAIKNSWWSKSNISIKGYSGEIYGGDVYFTSVKDI